MSSSTFEVKESESDSEKVLDFGLESCEENGIMATQSDGELPKDHTYTKEPDVLEDEDLKENDNSNNQPAENMDNSDSTAENPKTAKVKVQRPALRKNAARGKAKKAPAKKDPPASKKSKAKKDDVIADVIAVTEDLAKVNESEKIVDEIPAPAEDQAKPAKRGRKRKIEEKENLIDQNSTEEPVTEAVAAVEKSPPKKKSTATAKETKVDKVIKKKPVPLDGMTDQHNLPKGWVRKTVVRKTGKSAGQIDVYIYSPDGFKFRSKPDVAAYLQRTKSNLNLEVFDFSKKSVLQNTSVKEAVSPPSPKKKPAIAAKSKAVATKKKAVASPKKTPKLLVKIVSDLRKKRTIKKSTEKEVNKTPTKGKKTTKSAAKATKKKKNA